MMLVPGTLLGDRYEIVEKIGAGGMSIVYKAKCNKLQRFVAIKVLREEFAKDEEFVAKFRKEALSAASLSHPNIVGIYDVGSDHDLHYIVMELVEGKTLKEVIAQKGPFSSKTVLELGIQIVSALKHAHKKKIIHRDIKPQNILMTHDNVLKVTDFGIAKAVDSSTIVATGNAIGSVHYFSPEQAKGKYVNETSDLYSCGIVLFELATKKLPFEADSHISIALKHINEEMPRPSSFNESIMPGLEQLILKATRKSQAERYQNSDEILKDIRGILSDPHYVVEDEMMSDHTVLLSEVDTDFIRKNSYAPSKEYRPSRTNMTGSESGKLELEEEDTEEISTLYKVLVSIGGVLATLVLIVIVSAAAMLWLPSLGQSKEVVVPNFLGKTMEQAENLAKSHKLNIKMVGEEETNEVPVGTVYKQTPTESQKVKRKSTIELVFAKGGQGEVVDENLVKVPDILNQDSVSAEKLLIDLGFVVDIKGAYDDVIEKGRVVSQKPGSNESVAEGSIVEMIVSRGPQVVFTTVPNLLNISLQDAQVSLRNAKLEVGAKKEEENDTIAAGFVISQGVSANTKIEEGSSIDLVISKGKAEVPETTPPTDTTAPDGATKYFTLEDPTGGLKDSQHVVIKLVLDDGTSKVVYDAVVSKDQFPLSIPIKGKGQGLLYTSFDGSELYQDVINFNEVQ